MPVARYLAEIDWNNDGDYLDTGEDVSSRVRGRQGIKAMRGRDQIRVLAPPMAGSSSLTLDNSSRDYSAENAGSPLAGYLLPGRAIRTWATAIRAEFDGPDDATGLEDAEVGGAWITSGTWGISSQRAYSVTDANGNIAQHIAGRIEQRIICMVRGTLNSAVDYRSPALFFRYINAGNYLVVRLLNGVVDLRKVEATVESSLTTAAQATADNTDYAVEIVAIGTSIQVIIDGTLRIDYTLAGGDVTLYAGTGATRCGMRLDKAGSPATAARWGAFYAYVPLAAGRIDDFIQHPEPGVHSVEIRCLGNLARLRGKKISTALYQNITTDTALGYVLDAIGWTDTADRIFDTGKTTLLWWWLDNEDAFDAACALLNTEGPGASLYEDALGRIHFESRHYRMLTTRCTASQATISDSGTEPLHSRPLVYDPGHKSIINYCAATVKTRSAKSLSVIWTLGATVTLGPNEVRKYQPRYGDGTPFTGAITPASGTDYTLTAGAVTPTLDRTSGASCTLTLTAGAAGATLTGLQMRAQLVSVDYTTAIANTIDMSTSQNNYGLQTYTLPIRQDIAVNDAQDFCNAIVSRYQNPRPTAIVTLNNGSQNRLAQMLRRQLSDLITIVDGQTGLNTTMWIERIEHAVGAAGQIHQSQFGCEKATDEQYWLLGDATWSLLGESTYLGY